MKKLLVPVALGLAFALIGRPQPSQAATTTMVITPSGGEQGSRFKVDLLIDGHGERFNAAEAKVTVSDSLVIEDLTLGDCGFSYLTTPSIVDPSFQGVLLSQSSQRCTVYTLQLVPTALGKGIISLEAATVRRYGDAAEILSSTQNGNFTITATSSASVNAVLPSPPANGLYAIYLKVISAVNQPEIGSTVTLADASGNAQATKTTDTNGAVSWADLQPGIYIATVTKNQQKQAEQIINVTGRNPVLTLNISLAPTAAAATTDQAFTLAISKKNLPLLLAVIIALGLGCLVGLFYLKKHRKPTHL